MATRRLTKLRLTRLIAGLQQVDVARLTEIPCSRLSMIETGRLDARTRELEKLAGLFGVDVDSILGEVSAVPGARP